MRVWVPVVVAALVQLGSTFGAIGLHAGRWGARHGSSFAGVGPLNASQPVSVWVAAGLVLLALAGPAVLVVIRRRPGPLSAAVSAAAIAGVTLSASQGLGAAFYLSVFLAVAIAVLHGARPWAWGGVTAYWLAVAAASLLSGDRLEVFWLVPLTILSVASLAIPEAARSRHERREQWRRETAARQAEQAQAERVRIARELHDVLAHSLSQINVQASVGLHLFEQQPGKAAEALASIKDSSRTALAEVRQVLGVLRDGADAPLAPEPELSHLPALAEGARTPGTDVALRLEVTDASRIPLPVQQTAYRIVQEALTNVGRHARARHVEVAVVEEDGRLAVRVTDDGVGGAAQASVDGRGLLGMRERAELLGGALEAGPRPEGGFEVLARLPIGGRG